MHSSDSSIIFTALITLGMSGVITMTDSVDAQAMSSTFCETPGGESIMNVSCFAACTTSLSREVLIPL
ncbi:Uncharacterised protein [Candidatus Burarchaeum australiense]|nr:Uncharacterised protein [Candidatus Burarchaeum australiense]